MKTDPRKGVNQTASQKLTATYRSTLTSTVKRVVLSSGWALKALTLQLCWTLKIQEWFLKESTLKVFHISFHCRTAFLCHTSQTFSNHGTFASSRFLLLTLMTLPLFLSFIHMADGSLPSKWHEEKLLKSLTLFFSWKNSPPKKIHPSFRFICESHFLRDKRFETRLQHLPRISGSAPYLSTQVEDFNFQTSKSAGLTAGGRNRIWKAPDICSQKLQWSTVMSTISKVAHLAVLDYGEILCCLQSRADSSDIVHFQVTQNICIHTKSSSLSIEAWWHHPSAPASPAIEWQKSKTLVRVGQSVNDSLEPSDNTYSIPWQDDTSILAARYFCMCCCSKRHVWGKRWKQSKLLEFCPILHLFVPHNSIFLIQQNSVHWLIEWC